MGGGWGIVRFWIEGGLISACLTKKDPWKLAMRGEEGRGALTLLPHTDLH